MPQQRPSQFHRRRSTADRRMDQPRWPGARLPGLVRPHQPLLREASSFPDRKTQPALKTSGRSGSVGGGGSRSQGRPAIGPPSQQVSRMAPHWRQCSLARISWVSPLQMGHRGDDVMGLPADGACEKPAREAGRSPPWTVGQRFMPRKPPAASLAACSRSSRSIALERSPAAM